MLMALALSVSVRGDNVNGNFSPVDDLWQVIPLHVSLTPQGNVIGFGATPGGAQTAFEYEIWNPSLGQTPAAHNLLPNTTPTNLFCAAQLVLPSNDQLMTMGGLGASKTAYNFIDPVSGDIVIGGQMTAPLGRYYATSVVLQNGDVALLGGSSVAAEGPGVITPEF